MIQYVFCFMAGLDCRSRGGVAVIFEGIDYALILKKALRNGGDFADIFAERSSPLSIICDDDRVEKVISGLDSGAGVRVVFGSRTAYAYTNDVTLPSLLELADAVSRAVQAGSGGPMKDRVINLSKKKATADYRIKY